LSFWGILIWEPYAPVAWAEALAGLALTVAAITVGPRGGIRDRPGARPPVGPARQLTRVARRAGGTAVAAAGVVGYLLPLASPQLYGNAGVTVALTADGRALYTIGQPSGFRGYLVAGPADHRDPGRYCDNEGGNVCTWWTARA
jgi:hypothetical protein